jgi:HEPN domain-containing protein
MANAKEWLAFANEDRFAAKEDLAGGTVPRITCFNSQQAAEKLLKAVLAKEEIPFPRTHDLGALEALLPPHLIQQTSALDLGSLTDWSVQSRYPDSGDVATHMDAKAAVQLVDSLFEILEPFING